MTIFNLQLVSKVVMWTIVVMWRPLDSIYRLFLDSFITTYCNVCIHNVCAHTMTMWYGQASGVCMRCCHRFSTTRTSILCMCLLASHTWHTAIHALQHLLAKSSIPCLHAHAWVGNVFSADIHTYSGCLYAIYQFVSFVSKISIENVSSFSNSRFYIRNCVGYICSAVRCFCALLLSCVCPTFFVRCVYFVTRRERIEFNGYAQHV